MGFWKDGSYWTGKGVTAVCVLVILGLIFALPALTGFYKLEPNHAAIEVSRVTGTVSSPIMYIENGGVENIHYRYWLFTRMEKYDTKIHTVSIQCFGEQREGSFSIFQKEGVDYEQWPNNIIIGYRLEAENLDKYYVTVSESSIRPDSFYTSRRPVTEELIRASVFSLLTEGRLSRDELQSALNENLDGQEILEITSVDFTRKITS